MLENLNGATIGLFGAGIAVFLAGIGSAIGVGIAGRSATGVLSEKPERYGTLFLMVVLPSTQGIYGFLVGFTLLGKLVGPSAVELTAAQGWTVFAACMPVAFAGLLSGIHQGKVCAAGILMAAKRPEMAFKAGVIYAVMVELYAVLGWLVSTMASNNIFSAIEGA
jgi:V/A-type H+-transporting ATPase subunit K